MWRLVQSHGRSTGSRAAALVSLLLALQFFAPVGAAAQNLPKPDEPAESPASDGYFQANASTGDSCGTEVLARNDDLSTGAVPMGFTVNFYGSEYELLYVNNNGNVTFDAALGTYTPFGLIGADRVIIAPFFADVDTRPEASGVTTYGQTTVDGRAAFCVSWNMVGYYNRHTDKLNDFHLVLVDRSDLGFGSFDIIFEYNQIQWETGDASSGVDGLGGTSAAVGFASPGGATELSGSLEPGAFLDSNLISGLVWGRHDSPFAGKYKFEVRGGLPPRPDDDEFVYAAFGDSYSSGEGVPAYEDGSNYPDAIEQENTRTADFGGNGCHRSLRSYAKINIEAFEPDQVATLVERSCSGAQIVPDAGGTPIAPTSGTQGTDSQVDQAVDRLERLHSFRPEDVDLVTATMGGNDIGFGDVVAACLAPSVVIEAVDQHPNPPTEAGIIGWLAGSFGTCDLLDRFLGKSRSRIASLPSTMLDAQQRLRDRFDNAEILQLTYPHAVPEPDDFPGDYCGGIRSNDAEYARETVELLNEVVRDSARTTGVQIVDLESAFGSNPLCPTSVTELVHGIDATRLDAVVATVLADGSTSRELIDEVLDRYGEWRNCKLKEWLPFTENCDAREQALTDAANDLGAWFAANAEQLVGLLVEGDTEAERFENSRALFHPTQAGVEVMACHVRAAYGRADATGCATSHVAREYLIDGAPLRDRVPINAEPGETISYYFNAFGLGIPIRVVLYSEPLELGTVFSDDHGVVSGELTLPDGLTPGVHRLVFDGEAVGGAPRTIEVLIRVEGRPLAGDDYGFFLCCFEPGELVPVTLLGSYVGTWPAGSDGAIVGSVPIPELPEDPEIVIEGAGRGGSQSIVVTTIQPDPEPSPEPSPAPTSVHDPGPTPAAYPAIDQPPEGRAGPAGFGLSPQLGPPAEATADREAGTAHSDDEVAGIATASSADSAGPRGLVATGAESRRLLTIAVFTLGLGTFALAESRRRTCRR